MSGKKTAVFGIYSTLSSADHATDTLVHSGFSAERYFRSPAGKPRVTADWH